MAIFLAHLAVSLLAPAFPRIFDLPALLFAAYANDLDYFLAFFRHYARERNIARAFKLSRPGLFHSLLGCLILFIAGYAARFLLRDAFPFPFSSVTVLSSLIFGLASHLVLDIPCHPERLLFYPFRTGSPKQNHRWSMRSAVAYSFGITVVIIAFWGLAAH